MVQYLDGALGTFLEANYGLDISGPLWSAKALCSDIAMEKVMKVYSAYLEAGCTVLTSMNYQAAQITFKRAGVTEESEAKRLYLYGLMKLSEAIKAGGGQGVIGAISMGSFGCSVPGYGEFSGSFGPPEISESDIIAFHDWRIQIVLENQEKYRDWVILFETIPCLMEVRAICKLLERYSIVVEVWVSMFVKMGKEGILPLLGNGVDTLSDAVKLLSENSVVKAIGVNCCNPRETASYVKAIRNGCRSDQKVLCYPNGKTSFQDGVSVEPKEFASLSKIWVECGADIIGGCCFTTPQHLSVINKLK